METAIATRLPIARPRLNDVTLRILWKEFRVLRGLAVGVCGIAVFVMAVLAWFSSGPVEPALLLAIAFASSALFIIGASVMLFAAERDEGTVVLLQLLPQNRAAVLFGKVAAAVAMTLVVLGVLVVVGLVYSGFRASDARTTQSIVSLGVMFLIEALAWGMLMSLVCPNPLLAAVMGIAIASLSAQLAMWLTVHGAAGFTFEDYRAAFWGRLTLAAAAGAIDVILGLRWLGATDSSVFKNNLWRRTVTHAAVVPLTLPSRPRPLRAFSPLLWQTIRQSWKAMLSAIGVGIFLIFSVELLTLVGMQGLPYYDRPDLPFSLLFVPALIGALVFRADQRGRQYRFLAEHAGRPRVVWLARQAVGLGIVILLGVIVYIAIWSGAVTLFFRQMAWRLSHGYVSASGQMDSHWTQVEQIQTVYLYEFAQYATIAAWVAWITAYAMGQFLSLTLRSAVLAGMLSLGASVMLLFWTYAVLAWQLSPFIFISPIAIGALAASWLRARDWMFDMTAWSRWLAPIAAAVLPIALMLGSIPATRLAQVGDQLPPLEGGLSLQSLSDWARQETALGQTVVDQYQTLSRNFSETRSQNSGEFDEEIKEQSQVKCRIAMVSLHDRRAAWVNEIVEHALARALHLSASDLDASLEMLLAAKRVEYQMRRGLLALDMANWPRHWGEKPELHANWLSWATAPGQTAERIQRALRELREGDRRMPTPTDGIVNDYLRARRVIRGSDPPRFLRSENRPLEMWLAYLAHGLPGESARAEKALDILAGGAIDFATRFSTTSDPRSILAAAHWREQLRRFRHSSSLGFGIFPHAFAIERRLNDYSYGNEPAVPMKLNMAAQTSYFAVDELPFIEATPSFVAYSVADVTRLRLERVRLALIAYRWKHGQYPASLKALEPDLLFESEYQDPYGAGALQYRPEGFELPSYAETPGPLRVYPPRAPMLWSVSDSAIVPIERNKIVGKLPTGEFRFAESSDVNNEPSDIDWMDKLIWFAPSERPGVVPPIVLTLPTELPGETAE